jgi:hypothetical protein
MKVKKHYNSFNPKLGFFLDIDEVLSWFEAEPGYFADVCDLFSLTSIHSSTGYCRKQSLIGKTTRRF